MEEPVLPPSPEETLVMIPLVLTALRLSTVVSLAKVGTLVVSFPAEVGEAVDTTAAAGRSVPEGAVDPAGPGSLSPQELRTVTATAGW